MSGISVGPALFAGGRLVADDDLVAAALLDGHGPLAGDGKSRVAATTGLPPDLSNLVLRKRCQGYAFDDPISISAAILRKIIRILARQADRARLTLLRLFLTMAEEPGLQVALARLPPEVKDRRHVTGEIHSLNEGNKYTHDREGDQEERRPAPLPRVPRENEQPQGKQQVEHEQ